MYLARSRGRFGTIREINGLPAQIKGHRVGTEQRPAAGIEYTCTQSMGAAIDRVTSISFIAALPEKTRQRVVRETREVLLTQAADPKNSLVKFPYRVDLFWTTRCD